MILWMMAAGALSAAATYFLQQQGLSAVVASCVVGLLGAGIGSATSQPHLSAMCFAGSFVGMTALHIAPLPLVMAAGALAGLIYTFSQSIFPGFGGRLGTIAFISCATAILFLRIIGK